LRRGLPPGPLRDGDPGGALTGQPLARAHTLFVEHCSSCHLKAGTGDPKLRKDGIPNFTDQAWHRQESDEDLRESIGEGEGKVMPPFKDELTPEEIDLLVRYIRTLPGPANTSADASSAEPERGRERPPST
jgi:mono/diheme cytochrome c family protein